MEILRDVIYMAAQVLGEYAIFILVNPEQDAVAPLTVMVQLTDQRRRFNHGDQVRIARVHGLPVRGVQYNQLELRESVGEETIQANRSPALFYKAGYLNSNHEANLNDVFTLERVATRSLPDGMVEIVSGTGRYAVVRRQSLGVRSRSTPTLRRIERHSCLQGFNEIAEGEMVSRLWVGVFCWLWFKNLLTSRSGPIAVKCRPACSPPVEASLPPVSTSLWLNPR